MSRPARLGSFSLIEVLLAMAILSILMVILFGMLGSLTTAWQMGQAHNERRTTGQVVLDRITRDLSQATLPYSRFTTNGLQMVVNPAGVGSSYLYPHSLFWQAPVATDGGAKGNLAVVGYFVQWVGGTPGTPCLSRVLINPSSPDYAVYSAPNAWISDALLQKYAPASFVADTAANNYAGLMAENVLGLWVQALDPLGAPIHQDATSTFDSRYTYAFTNINTATGSPIVGGMQTNVSCAPGSVQIAIAVMDSRTARRLTAKPTYPATTGNWWTDVQSFYNGLPTAIRNGTEIQTATVPLANAPR